MEKYIVKLQADERENLLSLISNGSWLNIAEIELSHLSRQCLERRIPDKETFALEMQAWGKERNENKSTVDWRFTANDARIKLKRLCLIIKSGNQN
jgi:hypothetical protein